MGWLYFGINRRLVDRTPAFSKRIRGLLYGKPPKYGQLVGCKLKLYDVNMHDSGQKPEHTDPNLPPDSSKIFHGLMDMDATYGVHPENAPSPAQFSRFLRVLHRAMGLNRTVHSSRGTPIDLNVVHTGDVSSLGIKTHDTMQPNATDASTPRDHSNN